jgi:hypothetical protein
MIMAEWHPCGCRQMTARFAVRNNCVNYLITKGFNYQFGEYDNLQYKISVFTKKFINLINEFWQ